jgi:ProP effector
MTRRAVRSALHAYTRRRTYLAAVKAGAPRLDLDGKAAGEVTPQKAAWAKEKLGLIDAAAAARRQGGSSTPQPTRNSAKANSAKHKAAPSSAPVSAKPPHDKTHTQHSAPVQRDGRAARSSSTALRRRHMRRVSPGD